MTAPARARRRDGELTRRRVIDAAVESILDVGYYRSSTNEIARRAGVTWGVLQHQFGTREALLLDVLEDLWARLDARVADARLDGESLEDRLAGVLRVLESHYGHPEHLVAMQIGLDLAKNPKTSDDTRSAVRRHAARLGRAWQTLCATALGELGDAALAAYAFETMRGYLVGQLVAGTFTRPRADGAQRALLIHGIAASVRDDAARRGLPAA